MTLSASFGSAMTLGDLRRLLRECADSAKSGDVGTPGKKSKEGAADEEMDEVKLVMAGHFIEVTMSQHEER